MEKLCTFKPELKNVLFEQGGDAHVETVAKMIVNFMGAGRKFREFILEFLPPPPEDRPKVGSKHPWNEKDIKKTLNKIYQYRSDALHGGKTFPAPMCFPPLIFDGIPNEVPFGLATMTKGGTWKREDTPILLHTFEYIVRGALLNWWASLIAPESN